MQKPAKMRAGAVGLRGRTLFSTFVTLSYGQIFKFQILSPLLPLNLWLNFENLTHCPFKEMFALKKNNYEIKHEKTRILENWNIMKLFLN